MLTANKIKIIVACLIMLCVITLSNCIDDPAEPDLRGEAYAASNTCRKCHQAIYDSYIQTAHFNTSSDSLHPLAVAAFGPGKNVFRFNDSVQVIMEKIGGKYYQTYFRSGKRLFTHPFDIVVGSGRKAQTFLYYNDQKKISQLPVSYFISEHAWANSPGFPAQDAKFDRNVPSYCMGCHSSHISVKQTYKGVVMQEEFEKNQLIYGIDCQRCHGPAQEHVNYFTANPQGKQPNAMVGIRGLTRIQKNDLCGQCHSGFRDVQQSLFKFKPGDNLNDFFVPHFGGLLDTATMDVHGNQAQLMMASKCFQMSNDLTCNSCHNVHTTERDMDIFSKRCVNCHQQVSHSFAAKDAKMDNAIQQNCIDCHMPLKPSSAITMLTNQKKGAVPDLIRTHLIAVYDQESKKWMDSFSDK